MRRSDPRVVVAAIAVAVLFASACVVKLDHEFDSSNAMDAGGANADAPVAPGCRALPGVASLAGDLRSIAIGGEVLFVAEHASSVDGAGFLVRSPGSDCAWSATGLGGVIDPSPIRSDAIVSPLDLVTTDGAVALYYTLFVPDSSAAFGVRSIGIGIAPRDAMTGRFVPTNELLWSADRAPYGGSALRVGDFVYAYGCVTEGFLAQDCYVARVPPASVASISAYVYFDGASWTPSADASAAIVHGAGSANVRYDAASARFVMTYVPPLATKIVARTALAPEGPWSGPTALASCDLAAAGRGAFCVGGHQHALLGVPAGSIAVSYAAATFEAGGASADAFAPRLVVLPVP